MKHKPNYPALIQEYEHGGQKQRDFCQRNKIKYSTFQFWLSRIRKQKSQDRQFLPVRVIDQSLPGNNAFVVEINYPDGTVLKLNQATAALIKQFLPGFTS